MSANCVPAIPVPRPPVETVSFLGVKIDLITRATLLDLVSECISAQRKVVIAHHNLHSVSLHRSSPADAPLLRRFYDRAHYTLADGMSMVVLGRLLGHRISPRHRVAYNDWLPVMLPVAVDSGWRIFYLGSTEEIAAKGAEVLRARYPGLQLKVHHGHFETEHQSDSNVKVVAEICDYRPNILFVGMGVPRAGALDSGESHGPRCERSFPIWSDVRLYRRRKANGSPVDGQTLFGMGISPGDGAAKTRIPLPGGTVGSSKSGSGE